MPAFGFQRKPDRLVDYKNKQAKPSLVPSRKQKAKYKEKQRENL